MIQGTAGRTWDDASSPSALRLARRFETAWRDSSRSRRPDLAPFLVEAGDDQGARLALLRAEMGLRWEDGDRVEAQTYRQRYPDLASESLVALIYEEFCLLEDAGDEPDPRVHLERHPEFAQQLRRILDIHDLVGNAGSTISLTVGPGPQASGFPKAGETIAGFHLVEELGRGAFARVFLAQERQLANRPVALKVARTGTREPQTLARLQHTHIVPVHSYRTDPATGLHLLCMPYFGRVTLAHLLADGEVQAARSGAELLAALDRLGAREAPVSGRSPGRLALAKRDYPRALAWWGARMAEALEHAHDHGVLHRDIKPSNVLVTLDGLPMLLDFNLAREATLESDEDESLPGGTLDYMSPEHLEELAEGCSDRVDARSDVYGLGVLLFEALVGRRPFSTPRGAASAGSLLLAAAEERRAGPPRLRVNRPDVPAAFEAVVLHCLAPEPCDRYATASDLALDLQAIADDQPLRFAREPMLDRVYRFLRRHHRILGAACSVLVAIGLLATLLIRERVDRSLTWAEVKALFDQGAASEEAGDLAKAQAQFEAAARLSDRPDAVDLRRQVRALRAGRPQGPWASLEELGHHARQRFRHVERSVQVRQAADAVFRAADSLRFRLTGFGGDLPTASRELLGVLEPFFVFGRENWHQRADLGLLDAARRPRLIREVDEILFLWAIALDRAADREADSGGASPAPVAEPLRRAVEICDRALVFVPPQSPWPELREHLVTRLSGTVEAKPAAGAASPSISDDTTALTCFERERYDFGNVAVPRPRPVSPERSGWSRGITGIIICWPIHTMMEEEIEPRRSATMMSPRRCGPTRPGSDSAGHDSTGPEAPGAWRWRTSPAPSRTARPRATPPSSARPASSWDWCGSRWATWRALAPSTIAWSLPTPVATTREAPASIAPSSTPTRARPAERSMPTKRSWPNGPPSAPRGWDTPSWPCEVGRSPTRRPTCSRSRGPNFPPGNAPRRLDSWRSRDWRSTSPTPPWATPARRWPFAPDPGSSGWNSALCLRSARSTNSRWSTRRRSTSSPSTALPFARMCAGSPIDWPRSRRPGRGPPRLQVRIQRLLDEAIARSFLGERERALELADQAVARAPASARALLTRARLHHLSGHARRAWADVESARALEPDDPRVWQLRGRLRAEAGDPERALADLDRAIALGEEGPSVRVPRAQTWIALGDPLSAVGDWSRALAVDPENPRSFLGRAAAFARLGQWDGALADLEQAAGWADDRPEILLRITLDYARCVLHRPDRLPRLGTLARRLWKTSTTR